MQRRRSPCSPCRQRRLGLARTAGSCGGGSGPSPTQLRLFLDGGLQASPRACYLAGPKKKARSCPALPPFSAPLHPQLQPNPPRRHRLRRRQAAQLPSSPCGPPLPHSQDTTTTAAVAGQSPE